MPTSARTHTHASFRTDEITRVGFFKTPRHRANPKPAQISCKRFRLNLSQFKLLRSSPSPLLNPALIFTIPLCHYAIIQPCNFTGGCTRIVGLMSFVFFYAFLPILRVCGVGLMIGVVDKVAQFSVSFDPTNPNAELTVEVKGPRGEYTSQSLVGKSIN